MTVDRGGDILTDQNNSKVPESTKHEESKISK